MRFNVTRIDRRHDNSACIAVVAVAIPKAGIEVRGIRIIRRDDGSVYANMPHQRDHLGAWYPTVRFMKPGTIDAIKQAAVEAVCGAR